jgi:membrane associated rhomboid family serine protease
MVLSLFVTIVGFMQPWRLDQVIGDTELAQTVVAGLFAYPDIITLVLGMFEFWIVGFIVEGKIGWWKFLACFLLLGLTSLGLSLLLTPTEIAPNALPITFALLGMAAVWSPLHDIDFYWFFFFHRYVEFSAPVVMVAIVYVGGMTMLTFGVGQPGVWLLATLLGSALASAMHFTRLVDCEDADIFAVLSGRYSPWATDPDKENLEFAAQRKQAAESRDQQLLIDAQEQLNVYLKNHNGLAALKLLDKLHEGEHELDLSEPQLAALVPLLHESGKWRESAPYMARLIELRGGQDADPLRLKLAQICVVELARPARALELLDQVDLERRPPEQQRLAQKIAAKADAMQEEGVLEVDDGAW